MVSKEVAWMALPMVGLLSQIGGTWWKGARRFLLPLLVVSMAWFFAGFNWWFIVGGLAIFGVATLPFTLHGDSIHDHWYNWLWVAFYAFILPLTGIFFTCFDGGMGKFLLSLIMPYIVILSCLVLSNVKATREYFPWKFCEAIVWMMAMYPAILAI